MGSRKNSTIRLSSVLDFMAYKNGVDIQKDRGKCPFLQFHKDIDLFAMLLGRRWEISSSLAWSLGSVGSGVWGPMGPWDPV